MKEIKSSEIKKNLVGGGDYATETGLYSVKDYGDGTVAVCHYDAETDEWGKDEDASIVDGYGGTYEVEEIK